MAHQRDSSAASPLTERLTADPVAPLRSYLLTKHAVSEVLNALQEFTERRAPWLTDRAHELMARLGEDQFELVVLGQFKRGKTSLINAIVGHPLLPTGVLPVTSAITSLRFGSRQRAVVHLADRAMPEEVSTGALASFVTERENPGNHKGVLSVDVEVPSSFLRRTVHLVDTPGIGSAQERNTLTTLDYLPRADAVIFVTAADGPLSQLELDFLDAVRAHVRKLFFVLNKMDLVPPAERREVVAYATRALATHLGVEAVDVFPVSAIQALAESSSESAPHTGSGLRELESALGTFLDRERRTTLLVALLDRAVRLLEEVHFADDLRRHAIAQPTDTTTLADLRRRIDAAEEDRQRVIGRMRLELDDWRARVLEPALGRFSTETQHDLEIALTTYVHSCSDARSCYSQSARSIRDEIERRARVWLKDTAPSMHERFHAVAADAIGELARLVGEPARIAAAQLGAGGAIPAVLNQTSDDLSDWKPPAFEGTVEVQEFRIGDVAVEKASFAFPLALTRPFVIRRLRRRVPIAVDGAVSELREAIARYVSQGVTDVDDASAKRLAESRGRLDRILTAEPLDVPSSGDLDALLARVATARDALLRGVSVPANADSLHAPEPASSDQQPAIAVAPTARRLARGTCVVCARAAGAVFDFLCHYQYGIGHDPATERQFLTSGGLCEPHTWQLEHLSSPRGLCAGYATLLDRTADRLEGTLGLPAPRIAERLMGLIPGSSICPACMTRRTSERDSARDLVSRLTNASDRAVFERSHWLCLHHLSAVLATVDDAAAGSLVRRHAQRLRDIAESMREYGIKYDARRRERMTDDETRAYRDALVSLVGERYLFRTEVDE
jgi:ribosome biogenesis GTPase A